MLLFRGVALEVKSTHNVISEFIRLNDLPLVEAIKMSIKDPMGWTRDMVYCFLRVYNPQLLVKELEDGSSVLMTKYEVGDELFKSSSDEIGLLMKSLIDDYIEIIKPASAGSKKVAEKK